MLGLAFANVAGVPAATWLGQHAGWRSAYWLVSGLAALTAVLVLWLVPHVAANRDATGRNELSAFRNPQVLLTLLAGAIGFGGMFAVYTYIAPTVTDVAGLGEGRVPLYLLAMGLGMVVGTPLGGRLADWSIFRSLLVSSVAMVAILVAFTFTSEYFLPGLTTVFLLTVAGSVLVTNLQMRLMQVAGNAQTIGAAMNHASLNVANALGAWLGGVVVAAGFGYTSTAWVGAALSFAGLLVLLASATLHRRTTRQVGRQQVVGGGVEVAAVGELGAAAFDPEAGEAGLLEDAAGGGVLHRGVRLDPVQPQPAVLGVDEGVPHGQPAGLGGNTAAASAGVHPVADLGLAAGVDPEQRHPAEQLVGRRVGHRPRHRPAAGTLLEEAEHSLARLRLVVGSELAEALAVPLHLRVVAPLDEAGDVCLHLGSQHHGVADDPRSPQPRDSR